MAILASGDVCKSCHHGAQTFSCRLMQNRGGGGTSSLQEAERLFDVLIFMREGRQKKVKHGETRAALLLRNRSSEGLFLLLMDLINSQK